MSAVPPLEVFYSYAPEDEALQKKLQKHLSSLRRQGLIKEVSRRDLLAGEEVDERASSHLSSASLIFLLVSSDYLNSDYYYQTELERAMKRLEAGEALVVPILLRPVVWEDAPFKHLDVLPTNKNPITRWSNQEQAFKEVAESIRRLVNGLLELPTPPTENVTIYF